MSLKLKQRYSTSILLKHTHLLNMNKIIAFILLSTGMVFDKQLLVSKMLCEDNLFENICQFG